MYDELETILGNIPSWSIRDVRGLTVRERKHWYKHAMRAAGMRQSAADERRAQDTESNVIDVNEAIRQRSVSQPQKFPGVQNPYKP